MFEHLCPVDWTEIHSKIETPCWQLIRVLFVGFIVSMLLGRLFHLALFIIIKIITIIFIGKMSRFKCDSLKKWRWFSAIRV